MKSPPKNRPLSKDDIVQKVKKIDFTDIQAMNYQQLNLVSEKDEQFRPEALIDLDDVDERDEILAKFVDLGPKRSPIHKTPTLIQQYKAT